MELKSMAIEKKEENCEPCAISKSEGPKYPYGLCLHLDHEAMEKLGMKEVPTVGSKVMIHAMCEVNSVSQFDSKDGGKNKSMSLQIVEMGMDKPKKAVNSKDFYPEKE